MRLDARLRAILDEISCGTLADIGCDHGKLAVSALLEGRARLAIAVDISAQSLHKCRTLGEEYKVSAALECRQGDGLLPLKEGEADFAVIAGMGGREIVKILAAKPFEGKLLLVPHQDPEVLRSFLSGKYIAEKDFAVCASGVCYPVIVARPGGGFFYAEDELTFGLNQPPTEAWRAAVKKRRDYLFALTEKNKTVSDDIIRQKKEVEALCRKYGIL